MAGQNLKQIVQIRFRCEKSICTYFTWKCFDISHKVQKVSSYHVLWLKKQRNTEFLKKMFFLLCFFMDQTRPVSGFEGFPGTDPDHPSTG